MDKKFRSAHPSLRDGWLTIDEAAAATGYAKGTLRNICNDPNSEVTVDRVGARCIVIEMMSLERYREGTGRNTNGGYDKK